MPSPSDFLLIQIVDRALVETAGKSGDWLVCKPGCTSCCFGVFAISQLDAARLRGGLQQLAEQDPQRAALLLDRVAESIDRLRCGFPGDPETGLLGEDPEAQEHFESFANEEPCPVLNRENGTCDLYSSRPMTCRVFGPPARSGEGLGVCELCYQGATPEEIAACEMIPDPDGLEDILLEDLERETGLTGSTLVAFALRPEINSQRPALENKN